MSAWWFLSGILLVLPSQVLSSSPPTSGIAVRIDATERPAIEEGHKLIVRAEPIEASAEGGASTSLQLVGQMWRGTLDLDRDRAWMISLEAEGFWAAAVSLEPGASNVELTMFPVGVLMGRLIVPPGEPGPLEVVIGASLASSSKHSPDQRATLDTTLGCPVVESLWICEIPAGNLDLRVSTEGFIPHYFWDTSVEPRQTKNLGPLRLKRGSSIAGWITSGESSASESPAQVVLERQVSGWQGDPRERRRLEASSLRGVANDRGFFQLQGIPAGGYHLNIEKRGFAAAQVSDLVIEDLHEVFLEEPIVLVSPITLELVLEPPTDPMGQVWLVTLGQLEPGSAVLKDRVETTPTVEGVANLPGLEPGSFFLKIDDAHGSTWVSRWIDVEPEMSPLFVDVPVIPIEGSVTSGGDPMRATVVFGSSQGAVQIHLKADEDGWFEGFLPREGKWPIDLIFENKPLLHQAVDPVEVYKRPGKRVAVVEIALSDTILTGQVLADNEPVAEANLAVVRQGEDRRREAILKTDELGKFEMHGLSPGELLIKAYKGKLSTSWRHVDLLEDRDPRLRLELRPKVELSGLVLSPAGAVPGAEVAAVPQMADGSVASLTRALSDFDGVFILELPTGTVAADLIVVAPGYALSVRRIPFAPDSSAPTVLHVDGGGGALLLADRPVRSPGTGDPGDTLHHAGAAVSLNQLIQLLVPKMKVSARGESLALLDMTAGDYTLCAASRGCDTGFLPPHGELALGLGPELAESP